MAPSIRLVSQFKELSAKPTISLSINPGISHILKSYGFSRDAATTKAYYQKFPLTPIRYLLQAEIDDMIWEVDEDCDRAVKWPEFQQMYHRCRHDKTSEMQIGMLKYC
jgi:hypothetical protein